MNAETYKQMQQDLISLAKSHNAEYVDSLIDFGDEYPCFTMLKHNVPTLADMTMLAEKYDVTDALISDESWGYVAIDFSMCQFKDEDDYNEFIRMVQSI